MIIDDAIARIVLNNAISDYIANIASFRRKTEVIEDVPGRVVRKCHAFNKLRASGPLTRSQRSGQMYDGIYESSGDFVWNKVRAPFTSLID